MDSRDIDWDRISKLEFLGLEDGMELRADEDGVILKVPHSTSWSRQETFIKSRGLYYGRHLTGALEQEEADHLRLGTLVHLAILEPDKFAEVQPAPKVPRNRTSGRAAYEAIDRGLSLDRAPNGSPTTKRWKDWARDNGIAQAGEWRLWQDACTVYVPPKDFEAASEYLEILEKCEGKETATPEVLDKVRKMAECAWGSAHVRKILERKGFAEREVHWTDPTTGIEVFAHPDWTARGIVADVKTTKDPSLEAFGRSIEDFGYARQAAIYTYYAYKVIADQEGWPEDLPPFFHICVGNEEPHDVCVYELHTDWIERGLEQYKANLLRTRKCLDADDWRLPESKGWGVERQTYVQAMPHWLASRDAIPMINEEE